MAASKRIEWVDIGKFICIMFVMLSHLESGTILFRLFYHPFYLTLFFFLSGYVYKQTATFKEHFIKKVKGLLVPWFVFSNFSILLSAVISFRASNPVLEMLWNLIQIREFADGLWFAAALFAAFIPFYFFIKWKKPAQACAASFVLSVCSVLYTKLMNPEILPWGTTALPWHLEYIFQAMLWMILGYYFREYAEDIFNRFNTVINRIFLWAVYLIIAYTPETICGGYLSIPLSYIGSILGILAVISLCKVMKTNRYISFVGANTLTYYALHGKIFAVIQAVLRKLSLYRALLENVLTSSAVSVVITILLSFILIIPSIIINRWFPWVLGRKYVKKG